MINTQFISQHKRFFLLTTLVLLLSQYTGCKQTQLEATKASFPVFGSMVDVTIYHANQAQANQAIQDIEQRFIRFHKEWHAWEQGGIISKINLAIANKTPIKVPSSVKDFILHSQQLSVESQGLFDPGIGKLISLWGFHNDNWQGPPPSKPQIQQWLKDSPSVTDVFFENDQLLSRNREVKLDFGGNAKGLAIDIAMQTLEQRGIQHAIVSIGGDMKAIGNKNGQPWKIGIQSPQKPEKPIASLELFSHESVFTSGDYQRFFEWQGTRYSHIINPLTGYPANNFRSVTVIHNNATKADAAATAILIAGPEQWQQITKSMQIDYAYCIDQNGNIYQTKAMQERVQPLAN